MSLARLFLSGVLVASGLILGAFTLHGYLDPDWAQRRMTVAGARASEPPAVDAFSNRSQFVARQGEGTSPLVAPPAKTATKSPSAKADSKAPAKPVVKKKVAEKPAKQENAKPPQQASVGFPWNLFSN
jgi:hypothetical protein